MPLKYFYIIIVLIFFKNIVIKSNSQANVRERVPIAQEKVSPIIDRNRIGIYGTFGPIGTSSVVVANYLGDQIKSELVFTGLMLMHYSTSM